jgi:ABC-2 type transport system ATP-binding protein
MPILNIMNIRKEYASLVAVNDITYAIEAGQVVGLIGPNGAGKTTLLRMLATVLPPTDGTADVCGFDLRKNPLDIRKKIGYLPDFFNLYNDLTLTECLNFFARAYGVSPAEIPAKIHQVLDYVNLLPKKDDFIRHLSRGMVQRMGLAVLLVHDPDIFLLDEPASGLDPMARIQLRDILKRLSGEGKTILISSHILTELSGFCSHIAIMNQGKLVLEGDIEHIEREMTGIGKFTLRVLDNANHAKMLIEQFPDVTLEKFSDSTFDIRVHNGPTAIADLNAHLVSNGIRVIHIGEQKTTLEDLFMQISREKNLQVS